MGLIFNSFANSCLISWFFLKDFSNSNPLAVVLVNSTGDAYNAGFNPQASNASYGVKNITTSATLVLAANLKRKNALVQNVERQQIGLGFNTNLTVQNAGAYLAPISSSSSGDGGLFTTDYTGAIYCITASGDADVRYIETTQPNA